MQLHVLDNPAIPWYAAGLAFTCTQCGNCCTGGPGYVWISQVEIERLAAFLGVSCAEVVRRYCRRIGERYSLKESINQRGEHDCIFLKEVPADRADGEPQQVVHSRRICQVYSVRPLQCRTWPFWEGNLATPQSWLRAGRRCPGINSGQHHSLAHIVAMKDARDWPPEHPSRAADTSVGAASAHAMLSQPSDATSSGK
jgi:Fe-S-cluster containining protein